MIGFAAKETTVHNDAVGEMAADAVMRLTARRGRFYPNKNFGTEFLPSCIPTREWAMAYGRQALDDADGVYLKNAVVNKNEVTYFLSINGIERQVTVKYDNL